MKNLLKLQQRLKISIFVSGSRPPSASSTRSPPRQNFRWFPESIGLAPTVSWLQFPTRKMFLFYPLRTKKTHRTLLLQWFVDFVIVVKTTHQLVLSQLIPQFTLLNFSLYSLLYLRYISFSLFHKTFAMIIFFSF